MNAIALRAGVCGARLCVVTVIGRATAESADQRTSFDRWLQGAHTSAHARRTAERDAAFLLPHLRRLRDASPGGLRLLDAGCGPGSITIGLAGVVAPGAAVGIDASPHAVAEARAAAAARGCANVTFELADIYALPFPDDAFDAVFSHAVMQHLAEPVRALRELRRVLRPGGVVAVADADHDGSIMAPEDARIDTSQELLRRLREHGGGGDPRVGKRLRSLLHDAGFARCEATASAAFEGAETSARMTGEFWANYLASPELVEHAVALGLATSAELTAMASAWREWGAHPGAFWARFWCEAIGWAE